MLPHDKLSEGRAWRCLPILAITLLNVGAARGEVVTTRSGLRLEGAVVEVSGVADNPLRPRSDAGPVPVKPIVMIDDDLRRVFVPQRTIINIAPSETNKLERIFLDQPVKRDGQRVAAMGTILRTTSFDDWGRRILTFAGGRQGQVDLVMGITEVTPVYTKVEGLVGGICDMRIRTTTIPRETLSRILLRHIDTSDPDERLKIVRLYIQSERFKDAREELEKALKEFPELTDLEKQVSALHQASARRLIDEIGLRSAAGQHRTVEAMIANFPTEGVAGETLLRVRDIQADYQKRLDQRKQVLQQLEQHLPGVTEGSRAAATTVVEEIRRELSINNLDRMADYLRLGGDNTLSADQRVSLAISGWLLGSGSGIDNLAVSTSLFEVRNLIVTYLRPSTPQHERDAALQQLKTLEGGSPQYVAKLLASMKPVDEELPEPLQDVPGLFELRRPGFAGEEDFRYLVQLPPEYDPYRRYPVIVTLHGAGNDPLRQIEWWAGGFSQTHDTRLGQATRRGFIVIAPYWTRPYQSSYEYSLREHGSVLLTLRDACRRFSIDTDRVFLSGHSMGGDAAWDIGLAHPDVWAGVLPVNARADKYIARYWENADKLPLYFVLGELDGTLLLDNASEFDRYLARMRGDFDTTVVEYRGRGHEHFIDEVQEMFTWMTLPGRRRSFFPTDFKTVTMRSWDNFFWWTEVSQLPERSMVNPVSWPDTKARPAAVEGRILNNRVVVDSAASAATIWLTPDLVDFDKQVVVVFNRRDVKDVAPSVDVMLDDVRSRSDRQHPFWAKVTIRSR
jgi:predicted esterase